MKGQAMGDRGNPEDWMECWFPGCEEPVEWSEGQYRWLDHEHHEGNLLAFASHTSRSGKTVYYAPVIYVGEANDLGREMALVQSFLFWPTKENPEGEMNPPARVYKTRLGDPDLVPWDIIERNELMGRTTRALFEALQGQLA